MPRLRARLKSCGKQLCPAPLRGFSLPEPSQNVQRDFHYFYFSGVRCAHVRHPREKAPLDGVEPRGRVDNLTWKRLSAPHASSLTISTTVGVLSKLFSRFAGLPPLRIRSRSRPQKIDSSQTRTDSGRNQRAQLGVLALVVVDRFDFIHAVRLFPTILVVRPGISTRRRRRSGLS